MSSLTRRKSNRLSVPISLKCRNTSWNPSSASPRPRRLPRVLPPSLRCWLTPTRPPTPFSTIRHSLPDLNWRFAAPSETRRSCPVRLPVVRKYSKQGAHGLARRQDGLWHQDFMIYLARLPLRLLADLVQFTALAFKPRRAIVAENLILRRQIALFLSGLHHEYELVSA